MIDEVAIEVADEKLESAIAMKEKTRKSRIDGGKFMYSLVMITHYVNLL